MSVIQYPPGAVDPHTRLADDIRTTELELSLLQTRAADVRASLRHCRLRYVGLTRDYQRLAQAPAWAEKGVSHDEL